MFDIQSILIYICLPIAAFFVAKYAERTDSKKAVWFIVVLFSLVAGLRATSVGIDTKTYDVVFDIVSNGTVKSMYGIEGSFIHICAVLLRIWDNNHFLFFVFALISHSLILFRIWKDREFISFRWSVFSYYIMFFAFSLNGMRQFVAVAIVIYATSFIKNGSYIKFALAVVIASLFHISAFIGMAYVFFELIFTKFYDTKRKMTIYLIALLGSMLGVSILVDFANRYFDYFSERASSLGFMLVIKVLLLALSFAFVEKPKNDDERYFFGVNKWYYFVGLLLYSLNYVFLYVGRIGLYFYVFEASYIGYLFKTKNRTIWDVLYKAVYVLLLLYYLYSNITHGAHGEIPYLFFWQN